eukprot:TRINITY_DN293_c0_g1_i2.p1 TRINITY_DN293_c0_g1~~TRINITY_DN293_c0_g1_i2.p1  ORF type:complete len:420 (+),score=151.49 TRINITY_DN293_c0_g1_i2:56-1261(+)
MLRTLTKTSALRFGLSSILPRALLSTTTTPVVLPDIDASKLVKQLKTTPGVVPPNETLVFGKVRSDHMLYIEHDVTTGWKAPEIKPYAPLAIDPAALCLHYAIECFEGMKAYVDKNGNSRLFRPRLNMERLNSSSTRLYMPGFDPDQMLECIKELVRVDNRWIPRGKGYSLYLRPTMIGTQASLGVGATSSSLLFVITSPVGPYFPGGFEPIRLFASTEYVRAWPGGTGGYKLAANYAPTIKPARLAAQMGYQQLLWLFGPEHYCTEVGTMNLFVLWKTREGKTELITAPLDGTILPGVTRRSIIELGQHWGNFDVTERPYTMTEVLEARKEDRLLEIFGAGTACVVTPVKEIFYEGQAYDIPLDKNDKSAKIGPVARSFHDTILAIQYGEQGFRDWSVVV